MFGPAGLVSTVPFIFYLTSQNKRRKIIIRYAVHKITKANQRQFGSMPPKTAYLLWLAFSPNIVKE